MSERMFPVLAGGEWRLYRLLECPREIPWSLLEPFRAQAEYNHSQTLERLAERGGLGASEIKAAVEGKRLHDIERDEAVCIDWLKMWLTERRP